VRTIALAGLAVAVLDIANAMIFWALYRGTEPGIILQSVAAGLLGRDAYTGGITTVILGGFLHLTNSCMIAGVYSAASRYLPFLRLRPLVAGSAYGVLVYLVMNHIVVPLSRATPAPFMWGWFLDNFIGHIVLVGLPIAFINRWFSTRSGQS
jgi:uncharacterized membrane protein YagU involved in acid resistance